MDSPQTLHVDSHHSLHVESHQSLQDFVLNLLTDPDARSAFDLDPEGALQAAGLNDITAADVQGVVPLVVDYAPVHGLAPVAPVAGQLGVDPLVTDATDVVGQLQNVTQQISLTSSDSGLDVKAGVLGAIAVDPSAVAVGATVLPGIGLGIGPGGLETDLTGAHDLAHTLDADVVGAVDTVADPVVGDVTGTAGDPGAVLGGADSGLLGNGVLGGDGLLGGALGGTQGQVGGLVDGLGVDDTLGGLGVHDTLGRLGLGDGGVVPPVDVPSTVGLTAQVDGAVSGTVGTVTGGVTGDADVHGGTSASAGDGLLIDTNGLI